MLNWIEPAVGLDLHLNNLPQNCMDHKRGLTHTDGMDGNATAPLRLCARTSGSGWGCFAHFGWDLANFNIDSSIPFPVTYFGC